MGDELAQSKIDAERMDTVTGNLASTVAFVEAVRKTGNLVAVLAGHLHQARADDVSAGAVQYLTAPACDGRNRLVAFRPMA